MAARRSAYKTGQYSNEFQSNNVKGWAVHKLFPNHLTNAEKISPYTANPVTVPTLNNCSLRSLIPATRSPDRLAATYTYAPVSYYLAN